MNEQKIYAVEEKISNANMLLNEIKSHYDEEKVYEENIPLEQKVHDFRKLVIAIDILHDCQMRVEDFVTDIMEYSRRFSEADMKRINSIKLLLGMDDEELENLTAYPHIVFGEGGAAS